MSRTRISTTVDDTGLATARGLREWKNDASMMDAALSALAASHRASEIDTAYQVYDDQPISEADAWGDLASFRVSAATS